MPWWHAPAAEERTSFPDASVSTQSLHVHLNRITPTISAVIDRYILLIVDPFQKSHRGLQRLVPLLRLPRRRASAQRCCPSPLAFCGGASLPHIGRAFESSTVSLAEVSSLNYNAANISCALTFAVWWLFSGRFGGGRGFCHYLVMTVAAVCCFIDKVAAVFTFVCCQAVSKWASSGC